MSLITVRELDQLFGSLYSIPTNGVGQTLHVAHQSENEDRYEIFAVGATKEDVKIDVQDGVLTVSVDPKNKSSFSKAVKVCWRLSKDSNLDSIDAKLDNGVLNVRIQKLKTPKKSISVSVN